MRPSSTAGTGRHFGNRLRDSLLTAGLVLLVTTSAAADPERWKYAWPKTDFTKHSVDLRSIRSGGPPRDGIPSIDEPVFVNVASVIDLTPHDPLISLEIDGDARAYPLRILMWHEIVNDTVGGIPAAITYCPLCNAAIVFDRRFDGQVLEFGTTGHLRNSDLVMYDRQTESWWQQYTGDAIVGDLTGSTLTLIASRLTSWERFRDAHPAGRVLVPNDPRARHYGVNPYTGYDTRPAPFLYNGELPEGIAPLERVVAVGDRAWSFEHLRAVRTVDAGDFVITWESGQASALDSGLIADGRDVGNITVRTKGKPPEDVPHHVTFAFVFHAFQPEAEIIAGGQFQRGLGDDV